MILFFSDFGAAGPYVGQMDAAVRRANPAAVVVNLFADAPAHDPQAAAYLLAAYVEEFPPPAVFLAVVDPGVGSSRRALAIEADQRWFVGPDNGLFEMVARRAKTVSWWEIVWRPTHLSASFHGRDLFAPIAARLEGGVGPGGGGWGASLSSGGVRFPDWPDDLPRAIYVDAFGNVMTGVRARTLAGDIEIRVENGRKIPRARTFSDVPKGAPFWYENANGLVEIAVNGGRADAALGLRVGSSIKIEN